MTNRTYDYDTLDRLISQSDNSGFKLRGYDANSNRTTAQFGGTGYPYTIASTSNRLTSAAGPVAKNYSYDASGNPLSDGDGATTFTWNAAGKLSTTVKNAKTHTYKYNALDQRISKNGPLSSKFFFFYDPAGQLIGEYRDNSGTATPTDDWLVRQETIWLEDIPVAVIRKATATSPILIYFIHTYHLNTPRVIVNQNNNPVWRWENTHAFGANLPDEDPDGNSQLFEYHPRFPGQYFDKETGLHYNYFRYCEPETGRYISPDPIGLVGGVNVYTYVRSNPLSLFDFLGLLFDSNEYASWMNTHAHLTSQHKCARYVRKGLEAGGANTRGHPISAKDYAPTLLNNGFISIYSENYSPRIGDTVIFQPYPGGSQHGHIQTYTGNKWVSDFFQNNFYPGRGYHNSQYQIYRAPDCQCSE